MMRNVAEIVEVVEKGSPGLLDGISREDGLTKEGLVRKVLELSHGHMVRTHHKLEARHSKREEGGRQNDKQRQSSREPRKTRRDVL